MRKLLRISALTALLPTLALGAGLALTMSRQVAAWPSQGRIEQAAELSAPAHRAPEAPRLQSDLERGQGGARHDRATDGILPSSRVAGLGSLRLPGFLVPVLTAAPSGWQLLGSPLFPTGPPQIVS